MELKRGRDNKRGKLKGSTQGGDPNPNGTPKQMQERREGHSSRRLSAGNEKGSSWIDSAAIVQVEMVSLSPKSQVHG